MAVRMAAGKSRAEGPGEQDAARDWRVSEPPRLSPILAHTLAAFEEHGYHGTSVRDIAARVGVTVPALYYHYENKQAILYELLSTSMQSLLARCAHALDEARAAGADPARELSALVECVVLFMAYRGSKGLLDSEIRSLEPDNRATYIALRDELDRMVRAVVETGVTKGAFVTEFPAEAARGLLTMCHAVAKWYRLDGPLRPEELATRYVALALGLVGHQPGKRRSKPKTR